MLKQVRLLSIIALLLSLNKVEVFAQVKEAKKDSFFLANKKGLLGKLGKSISTNLPAAAPQKLLNQFLVYRGKLIRSIECLRLDFEYNIYDTNKVKTSFFVRLAKSLHKTSKVKLIEKNLFFKVGDRLSPFLLADNERYLRDLVFIQDARIIVEVVEGASDFVDIIVLTKDIFSIGGRLSIDSRTRGKVEIKEENLLGSGTRIFLTGFYDKPRDPKQAFGGELVKRNIAGKFIDFTAGFQNFRPAFNSGRREETAIYTKLDKPLVTPYIPTTGSLEWAFYRTSNGYLSDSLYREDFKYRYYIIDGWLGYSLDNNNALYSNKENRVHRFIAIRGLTQRFLAIPTKYKTVYDFNYTDVTGALASFNIFKQSFYKTSFIYGFGRNEDIPEGFSVSLNGGWVKRQGIRRPYSGVDAQLTNFLRGGLYNHYTFRVGGYFYQKRFEDLDLLFDYEHITRLRKMSAHWFHRAFINTGITAQVNPVLNSPLYLRSVYGLPYFFNPLTNSDLRATTKFESVFYNNKGVLGFKFAPFIFADVSLLKPTKLGFKKADIYSAVGGGIRTRNENLVFGTVELRGYYFPRTVGDMRNWKIDLSSNIRFKYNSTFIKRPDFVIAN